MRRVFLALLTLLAIAAPAAATNRYVCAAGNSTCGGTPAYTTIALANAATVGAGTTDVINLKAGETFVCGVTVPNNVTYKTAVTTGLPSAGARIDTSYDALLATLQSTAGGTPCMTVPVGGHDVTIKQLRFLGNPGGFSDVIKVGQNDTTQQFKSEMPYNVTIDQIVIEPSLIVGQKRGVSMNGTNVSLTNSWIWVNAVGQDGQCANTVNTYGPIVFSNNYCAGGAEGGLFPGGDQAFIKTHASVKSSPSPTSTVFTVECFTGETCDAERRALVIGTGSTTTSIVLSTVAGGTPSGNDDAYNGLQIVFTSGTQNAVRTGIITSYNHTTKAATVAAIGGAPANGDTAWLLERVHTIGDLSIGDHVACIINGGREHSFVTGINVNALTVSPAFSQAPSTAADCRWGANVSDVTITKNYIYKDLAWRNPIMAAPQSVGGTTAGTGGTLAAGTYCYIVIANAPGYVNVSAYSAESAETCVTTTGTTSTVTLTWQPVTGAVQYRVWGRSSGGQTAYWAVTAPTLTFTDTGTAGTTATKSSQRNTKWTAKKLQEVKAGIRILIQGNVYDGNWQDGQTGFAISFKSSNAIVGSVYPNSYVITKDVTFENNVVRHTAGCYVIVGQEFESHAITDDPAPVQGLIIRNNLCYDSNNSYQNTGTGSNYATDFSNAANGFTFERNTIAHAGGGLTTLSGTVFTGTNVYQNNLMPANTNGIKGQGMAQGSVSLNNYLTTASYNAISGITSGTTEKFDPVTHALTSGWPAAATSHNTYPTAAAWQADFVNYGGSNITDYALKPGVVSQTAASDGGPLGADIAALAGYAATAIAGIPSSSPAFVTAAELQDGTVDAPYSVQLTSAGGTGTRTYALAPGSAAWPTGITMTPGGLIAGTPTVAMTTTPTVRVTDGAALFSDRTFTIEIAAAAVAVSWVTTDLPDGDTLQIYSQQLSATGGSASYAWSFTGTLPPGMTLGPSTGLLSGRPSSPGIFTFTVTVTSGSSSSPRQFTVSVTAGGGPIGPPLDPSPRPATQNGNCCRIFKTDPSATNGLRVNDIYIDPDGAVWRIAGTAGAVTLDGLKGYRYAAIQADNSETLVPASGGSPLPDNFQIRVYLAGGPTQCRVHAYVSDATVTGAKLTLQYYDGAAWQYLDGVSGPALPVDVTGIQDSAFVTLAAGAQADVPIRAFVTDGNSSNNVIFGNVSMECR